MPVTNTSALARGNMEGAAYGASVSLIFDHSEPGKGPRLHRHPYDETWVVIEGNLTFQLGDESLSTGPGDIVIAPAEAPHKFINEGPESANLVCIHASPTFRTEWLE
jgi:mannose-6-phosphate isomerase-like protein (cupin superfamily)